MGFEWDPAKSEKNRRERGFGFDFAGLIFDGDTIEVSDDRRDYGEPRLRAFGQASGVLLLVVYADRADTRRIISARVANRGERARWRRDDA